MTAAFFLSFPFLLFLHVSFFPLLSFLSSFFLSLFLSFSVVLSITSFSYAFPFCSLVFFPSPLLFPCLVSYSLFFFTRLFYLHLISFPFFSFIAVLLLFPFPFILFPFPFLSHVLFTLLSSFFISYKSLFFSLFLISCLFSYLFPSFFICFLCLPFFLFFYFPSPVSCLPYSRPPYLT